MHVCQPLDKGASTDVQPSGAWIALESAVKSARPQTVSLDQRVSPSSQS
jgi:hypothetical protein